jgi:hypothetical protein
MLFGGVTIFCSGVNLFIFILQLWLNLHAHSSLYSEYACQCEILLQTCCVPLDFKMPWNLLIFFVCLSVGPFMCGF